MGRPDGDLESGEEPPEVDLHGLRPEEALRRVSQEIHAARVRRWDRLKIITGRGWGNLRQQPVLRPKVEQWLKGPEGMRAGILRYEVADDGGSLIVEIRSDGHSTHWRSSDDERR